MCRRGRRGHCRLPGHAADRGARGHHLLQHVQPAAGGASSSSTSAPTCLASCATASRRWSTCAEARMSSRAAPPPTALHGAAKSECLGACADAPVMLVNDRQMLSFMSHERWTSWSTADSATKERPPDAMLDLSPLPGHRRETCFHGRHIGAQIYAGLNGSNWRLKDYEARGGYRRCARSSARRRRGHDARPGDRRGQGRRLRGRGGAGFPTGLKWSFMPRQFPGAEVPGLQLRRGRARHLQGPRHPDASTRTS
jgi:hypothetical protein